MATMTEPWLLNPSIEEEYRRRQQQAKQQQQKVQQPLSARQTYYDQQGVPTLTAPTGATKGLTTTQAPTSQKPPTSQTSAGTKLLFDSQGVPTQASADASLKGLHTEQPSYVDIYREKASPLAGGTGGGLPTNLYTPTQAGTAGGLPQQQTPPAMSNDDVFGTASATRIGDINQYVTDIAELTNAISSQLGFSAGNSYAAFVAADEAIKALESRLAELQSRGQTLDEATVAAVERIRRWGEDLKERAREQLAERGLLRSGQLEEGFDEIGRAVMDGITDTQNAYLQNWRQQVDSLLDQISNRRFDLAMQQSQYALEQQRRQDDMVQRYVDAYLAGQERQAERAWQDQRTQEQRAWEEQQAAVDRAWRTEQNALDRAVRGATGSSGASAPPAITPYQQAQLDRDYQRFLANLDPETANAVRTVHEYANTGYNRDQVVAAFSDPEVQQQLINRGANMAVIWNEIWQLPPAQPRPPQSVGGPQAGNSLTPLPY